MSSLIAISIGPVQSFIAAARRTRDLWFGSHMLSEISRAVARAVESEGGQLIFPADTKARNVANVILAELPDGCAASEVARAGREAAHQRWQAFAEQARKAVRDIIVETRWNQQVGDAVEFYAAWVPTGGGDYATSRARVMRLLAGRKALRDFSPAQGEFGVPKSSLDGARESVWKDDPARMKLPNHLARRLRLSEGEQLDAIGATKRLAGGQRAVPSVARIAADPWLRGAARAHPNLFQQFLDECRRLESEDLLSSADWPQFRVFPFEGTAVYRSRYAAWAAECGVERRTFETLSAIVRRLEETPLGEPSPYLAILAADGDRMGKTIAGLRSPDEHRKLSSALAVFADDAGKIVSDQYGGWLVYSGGDDVLAFLPLDRALEAARALHDGFAKCVRDLGLGRFEPPTLSAGIAVAHFLEPLEDLLSYARQAERAAKDATPGEPGTERNGLAIHYHPRGGVALMVRARWEDDLDKEIAQLADLHERNLISDKAGYDLRELAREYGAWKSGPELLAEAVRADARRLLSRKRGAAGPQSPEFLLQRVECAESAREVRKLAERLVLARVFANAIRQARGGGR